MAEGMHSSSDIPNYDTYPSTPPDRLLDTKSVGRSSLEERAAELGAAAGRIALILRQTKENVENLAQHGIYDRVTNLTENAKIRTEELRRTATARVQKIAHAAQDKAAENGVGGWNSRLIGRSGTTNWEGETCILRNQLQPSCLRPKKS